MRGPGGRLRLVVRWRGVPSCGAVSLASVPRSAHWARPNLERKGSGIMSEDQAERVAEHRQDRLDARYLRGELTEAEYARECRAIEAWVTAALRRVGG